jgi:hypothetical protein
VSIFIFHNIKSELKQIKILKVIENLEGMYTSSQEFPLREEENYNLENPLFRKQYRDKMLSEIKQKGEKKSSNLYF